MDLSKRKLEKYLYAVPKIKVKDNLLEKLKGDVHMTKFKVQKSTMHRWFSPKGESISFWRIAYTAIAVIAIVIPLSYGASKIIKTYFFEEKTTQSNQDGSITTTTQKTNLSGDYTSREEAKNEYDEISELKEAGKYERSFEREWIENDTLFRLYTDRYTLSSGKVIVLNVCEAENITQAEK